jgi:hypothetical protein
MLDRALGDAELEQIGHFVNEELGTRRWFAQPNRRPSQDRSKSEHHRGSSALHSRKTQRSHLGFSRSHRSARGCRARHNTADYCAPILWRLQPRSATLGENTNQRSLVFPLGRLSVRSLGLEERSSSGVATDGWRPPGANAIWWYR